MCKPVPLLCAFLCAHVRDRCYNPRFPRHFPLLFRVIFRRTVSVRELEASHYVS